LSLIDPKRRPLSALTLARFSSRWNSVDRPGWLHRCHRAAEKRCRSIRFAAAMSLACGRGSLSSRTKFKSARGRSYPSIVIQEAGLDGFWIHRLLQDEGVESYVVDPASIATSRRRRRAKTDKIDGEALVRALLAYKRGEPRVYAMVRAPTPYEEDRRPDLSRAQDPDSRAGRTRQSDQGSRRASLTMSPCCAKDARGLRNSGPVMVVRCPRSAALADAAGRAVPSRIPDFAREGRRLSRSLLRRDANLIDSNSRLSRSSPWRLSGMRCSACRTKARQRQEQC
jgi:hypothetical protein